MHKITPWQQALEFSFEMNPSKMYKLNGNRLPFGYKAFSKVHPDFYSEFIPFLTHWDRTQFRR